MKSVLIAALFAVLVATAPSATSQTYVLEGYQNCQRATNGRPYCQRPQNGETYFPVSDAFFSRYQISRDAAAARPQTVIQNNTINTTVVIQRLETEAAELRGMMDLYRNIVREQMQQTATVEACRGVAEVAREIRTAR